MATELDPAAIGCHRHQNSRAVAFGRWLNPYRPSGNIGTWRPWCQPCLDWQAARHADQATFQYVYLDPTRQRRPDHNHDGHYHLHATPRPDLDLA